MLDWVKKSDIIRFFFKEVPFETLLNKFTDLFGESDNKCEIAAVDIYGLAWGQFGEFGPMPPIDLLRTFEHDRVFYSNYRDHTTHTVKTWLIGLYIFEKNCTMHDAICDYIDKNNLLSEFEETNKFLFIWTITALYHDIGYIIENTHVDSNASEAFNKVIKYINTILQSPLANTKKFSSKVTSAREYQFISNNRIFTPQVNSIEGIEEGALFDELLSASQFTNLADKEYNGIKSYYDLAKSKKPLKRENFRDHGIASALLLLKVWSSYNIYITEISKCDYSNYYSDLAVDFKDLSKSLSECKAAINVAASAIALHNLNFEQWVETDTINAKLTIPKFKIKLDGDKYSLPFAFLLRLSDEIQMWGRKFFRAPEKTDSIIFDKQMSFYVSAEGLFLRFFEDDERFKYPGTDHDGQFYKLLNTLKKYLNGETIDKLLKYGDKVRNNKNVKERNSFKKNNDVKNEHQESNADFNSILSKEWLVGAINLDEDIHFSAYYLFQSLACNLPNELKKFGYQNIISFYDDFNETYFIPESECTIVSENIIKESEIDSTFWENLFKKINAYIKELEDVFRGVPVSKFSEMQTEELRKILQKHDSVHSKLYVYARIPEALDRGNSTFTNYLKNYLRNLSVDLKNETKLNEVFQELTYPENLSLNSREILELYKIVKEIKKRDEEDQEPIFDDNPSRSLINLDAQTRESLNEYAGRWAFWGYHGYRNRVVRDLNYFLDKLRVNLINGRIEEQGKALLEKQEENRVNRAIIYSKYDIDDKHKSLFYAYSKIGTIKISRRYSQLINFYYLDNLIAEIANRYRTNEAAVRCLLPYELDELLAGNEQILRQGEERRKSKTFVLTLINGETNFICGENARKLFDTMKERSQRQYIDKNQLLGEIVSKGTGGKITGVARVFSTSSMNIFNRGDILVCTDSDPDFFEYIKQSAAVLAEAGGLTCHSAIVCRELNTPCIVRVSGLMESIVDGDFLEINTDTGSIKKISSSCNNILVSSLKSYQECDSSIWGRKTAALVQMKTAKINVPEFLAIPIKLLRSVFSNIENDGKGDECQSLLSEISAALEILQAPFYAVRSSTLDEDGEFFSGAGQEITRLHVSRNDVLFTLENMLMEIDQRSSKTEGSIIVQCMIFGELSGVMFTHNPIEDKQEIIIESVRGGNEHMTSGKITPYRFVFSNGSVSQRKPGDKWGGECTDKQLSMLTQEAEKIEKIFNSPQDIEWTMVNNVLYILQSRNITGNKVISKEDFHPRDIEKSQLCISIFQKYALPLVLQDHLLRVAAVGKWIIDHWKSKEIVLDENSIIETLLLHDIGNIVKGGDDNFKSLFPDIYEMESFTYWENIRRWTIEHYGTTDTEATRNIIREIGINKTVEDMIAKKQFSNNKETCAGNNFSIKICAYADQRVSPQGIMSLKGRLNEAIKRYQNIKGASVNLPDRDILIKCATDIEKQIFNYVDGTPEEITDTSIEHYISELRCHRFCNLS